MNPATLTLFGLACLAASVSAIFDPITLGTVGTVGTLAIGTGTGTAFLTTAGVAAGAVGLVGAGVVAAAIASRFANNNRGKRDTSSAEQLAALQLIDSYFMTILDVDIDDCGKKLVCELKTLEQAERTDEENLIATLFDDSTTIDPLSAKAEYDLAAFIGKNYNKQVCARRYHKCELDRRTIVRGLAKLGQQEEVQGQE